MIQPMNKQRSGRAVLVVSALVASILAAGAVPAGAVTDRPDHTTPLSACVGDAAVDQLFADVSQGHVFRDAINCIAYYDITHGTGDGSTYSPEQDVTRAQMAVFIARAAEVAGVDLGPVGDARFNDIADIWEEAQDAINRIALKGMIPSGGAYRPSDAITRAEMASFLIGLLLEAAPNVSRDSTSGAILLGQPGSGSQADDRFPDAGAAEIAAIYELGVTRGASAATVQDDTEPPLDFNYEPEGTVNRGQMAAFITRALDHTSARPAGVSAQYDGADVIVSVRDARYQPVPGAVVDVFWTPADQAHRALTFRWQVPPLGSHSGRCFPASLRDRRDRPGYWTQRRSRCLGSPACAASRRRRHRVGLDRHDRRDATGRHRSVPLRVGRGRRGRFRHVDPRDHDVQRQEGPFRQHRCLHPRVAGHRRQGRRRRQRHRSRRVESHGAGARSKTLRCARLVSGPTGRAVFSISVDDPTPGHRQPRRHRQLRAGRGGQRAALAAKPSTPAGWGLLPVQ